MCQDSGNAPDLRLVPGQLKLNWHNGLLPHQLALKKFIFELEKLALEIGPLPPATPLVLMPAPEFEKLPLFVISRTETRATLGVFETTHRLVASFDTPMILFHAVIRIPPGAMLYLAL